MIEGLLPLLVVFAEPGFPVHGVPAELPPIRGAVVATNVADLEMALQPDRVLVWRHGSSFPAESWPALVEFLEAGGSMLYLGGEPFTHPVTGEPGQRTTQPRTLAMLKQLRLNQCYVLDAGGARLDYLDRLPQRNVDEAARVAILEPRLSDTRDSEHEDGAPGSRDAVLRPLAHLHLPGADPRFPAAAAAHAISRLRGRFAGGRWVFRLLSTPPDADELELLIAEARRPPADLRVDPTFGCFHEGERPSVIIRLHRPLVDEVTEVAIDLEIQGPGGGQPRQEQIRVTAGRHATHSVVLDVGSEPGLYRVTAHCEDFDPVTTGFWIFDRELFGSGDALSFDGYTLRRNGTPEPVVGTTTMSPSVHRKFLFEPNAAEWDDTFAELASLNINLVRTGVWSAYRKISLDPNVVDEAWLRALEAYYLSARRHGVPVVFTFFAFLPESFGGHNPYFDPRAREGQRAYVTAAASRFAGAREMLWDLINEPSFSSPDKLWQCRPNGDEFEKDAFRRWLKQRYATDPGDPDDTAWEVTVRTRWRLAPDEPIELPEDDDFVDGHLLGKRRPYRAKEYLHFAQHAFENWVADMTRAIRQAGSSAAITVGQDEGGLNERPNPQFHFPGVDFTSIHTWWHNDALLWDAVLAKAPGTPLLVSETGIMQREHLSGEALRSADTSAALLSRKLAYAFAGGAFGAVQWCYEVNPYMASDNEVAIGLTRVDGSYKPEHRVLRQFAGFVARNKARFGAPRPPEVVLVVPSADHFGPRELQTAATRRAVDLLVRELGVAVQAVSEYRTAQQLAGARLIVLPACRGISQEAWSAIRSAVDRGAVLQCSGWFETDDAGLPARRIGSTERPLALVEPVESDDRAAPPAALRFPLTAVESWYAATGDPAPHEIPLGKGRILHHPLPLEWAQPAALQRRVYQRAVREAGVHVPAGFDALRRPPGTLLRFIKFEDATLLVAVNESSSEVTYPLEGPGGSVVNLHIPAGAGRMFFLDRQNRVLDSSARDAPEPRPAPASEVER